jgi:hypothetical protein
LDFIAFRKILFMVRGAPARASCWRSNARAGAPPRDTLFLEIYRFWMLDWKTSAAFFRLMANPFLLSGCWLLAADG